MSDLGKAVFLSYASQDAESAQRLCNALRSGGIQVWFDQSELRGGDSWDALIRGQIKACYLFVPIISAHTQSREEGYFRREWNLAVARTLDMAGDRAFVLPVVIDSTSDADARVPEKFRDVQWTRLLGGEATPAFVAHIAALLDPQTAVRPANDAPSGAAVRIAVSPPDVRKPSTKRLHPAVVGAAVLGFCLAFFGAYMLWSRLHISAERPAIALVAAAAPTIAEKSVAVLPFVDMSEKKDQEYFSDGLSEQLIDMLTKIPDLQVPARTSSFYFKGKSEDIPTIARRLMVAHILEGSIRKSGNHLRITAQLVRADNGYHVWSETYDRELRDVFKIQDEIAGAVVRALKVSLLAGEGRRLAPTTSSEAYTLYLQALSLTKRSTSADSLKAIEYLRQATRMDPQFALPWALSAELYTDETVDWTQLFKLDRAAATSQHALLADWDMIYAQACAAGRHAGNEALRLGPTLAEAHLAMALVLQWCDWDWEAADAELRKARELDPGSAQVNQAAADLAITLGRLDEAKQLASRAVAQDPLGTAGLQIAMAAYRTGALDDAEAAYRKVIDLYPTATAAHFRYAIVLLARGKPETALAEFGLEAAPQYRQLGMPLALDALGRKAEADRDIAKAEYDWADGMAYQITYIYAARNDLDRAFYWLDRAYRQHDTGLVSMKGDPLLRNLLPDPRYKTMLRKLKLPE